MNGVKELTASVEALQLSPEVRCPPSIVKVVHVRQASSNVNSGTSSIADVSNNGAGTLLLISPSKKETKMETELANSHIKNSAKNHVAPAKVENVTVGAKEPVKSLDSPSRCGAKDEAKARASKHAAMMENSLKNGTKVVQNSPTETSEKVRITKGGSPGKGGQRISPASLEDATTSSADLGKMANAQVRPEGSPYKTSGNPPSLQNSARSSHKPLIKSPAPTHSSASEVGCHNETMETFSHHDMTIGENQSAEVCQIQEKEAAAAVSLPSSFQFYARWESRKKKDEDFNERMNVLRSVPPSRLHSGQLPNFFCI